MFEKCIYLQLVKKLSWSGFK